MIHGFGGTVISGHYVEVFNVLKTGYQGFQFTLVSFGLFLGSMIVFFSNKISFISKSFSIFFPIKFVRSFYLVFALVMLALSIGSFCKTFGEYLMLKKSVVLGTCDVTDGVVTNFQPAPYQGHRSESFQVDGKIFYISDYAITSAFHQTKSHGGPIDAGKKVRIYSVEGKIAKLEIWESK